MRVLVTGGAGFIGSHSVDHLLALGHRVRVLDDLSTGTLSNLPAASGLEVQIGDINDAAAVEAALAGVDAVLHLAAQVFVPRSIEDPVFSATVNVLGTLRLLDGARRHGVGRFVYASSAAVYGTPDAAPVRDDSAVAPLSPYGLEKLIDDQYAALFATLYGLSTCGMRYFNVYGPRQDPRSAYSGVISKFCDRIAAGAPLTIFGDGGQTRDFISVYDVARANAAALTGDAQGTINVATGHSVSLLELIAALGRAVGAQLEVAHQPARSGEVRDSRVAPGRLVDALGVRPAVSLDEGLRGLLRSLGVAVTPAIGGA